MAECAKVTLNDTSHLLLFCDRSLQQSSNGEQGRDVTLLRLGSGLNGGKSCILGIFKYWLIFLFYVEQFVGQ